MKKTWLDKLCEPLKHPKYPQIKGDLVKLDGYGKIIGKCAEGEIACQNKIRYAASALYLSKMHFQALGVPADIFEHGLPCLLLSKKNFDFNLESDDIGDYIVKLNDNGFNYRQIASFLRTTFEDAV